MTARASARDPWLALDVRSALAVLLVTLLGNASCGEAPPAKEPIAIAPTVSAEAPPPLRSATVASAAPSGSAHAAPVCTPECIAGTAIPGTDENRSVIAFCEIYRHALESGDVETLVSIASPKYYEDAGTPDPSDDLDRAGLERFLRAQMSAVSGMRAEFLYRSIRTDGDAIVVTYTYAASFQLQNEWKRVVDDNELRLARSADSFVILSGM